MTESKKEERKSEAELLWIKAAKLLENGEITLPDDLKESFLNLDKLTDEEQIELINKLSKNEKLPDVIRNLIASLQFKSFSYISKDIAKEIVTHLYKDDDLTLGALIHTNKRVNTLFKTERLFPKFIQQVVYGGQDKIEDLFKLLLKQGRDEEIQELLRKRGKFTDYSGRTFDCTAYEYLYWAKDTHMRRMLETYMDEDTKATMFERCEAIEKKGLTYIQNEKECCTKSCDLTPLKEALKEYRDGYKNWKRIGNSDAIQKAWMKIGLAQRDLPVHVINEYCNKKRKFHPTPEFNETELPRDVTYICIDSKREETFFPLIITETSGPGVDFALLRGGMEECIKVSLGSSLGGGTIDMDLLAITKLDEVRTAELKDSLHNLNPSKLKRKQLDL